MGASQRSGKVVVPFCLKLTKLPTLEEPITKTAAAEFYFTSCLVLSHKLDLLTFICCRQCASRSWSPKTFMGLFD